MVRLDAVFQAELVPFDEVVRVLDIELDLVHHLQVLHVRRVGGEHPGVAVERLGQGVVEDVHVIFRVFHQRQLEERLGAVEGPDDAPPLERRELEQLGAARRRIADAGLHALAVAVVFPVVKRALDIVADHLADAEVGADMRAVGAHHARHAVIAAEHDDPPVEEAAAEQFALRQFG